MRLLLILTTAVAMFATCVGSGAAANQESCKAVKYGILKYRYETWKYQDALGLKRVKISQVRVRGCAYARWVNHLWEKRADKFRKLASWYVLPNTRDWAVAVRVTQRVFPGTDRWLMSCSHAEGRHGRWVRFGGGSYYPGYEYTDAVGGNMQFRPSTFKGAFRRAYEYAVSKGFRIPLDPNDWINPNGTVQKAWFSPLGQALAAAYLRNVDGSYRRHWSASISNGCA